MGITKVVAINTTLVLGLAYSVRKRVPLVALSPVLYSSLVGFIVAVSSHPSINHVGLFHKKKDGYFPWWSRILFWPYMAAAQGYMYLRRHRTTEPVYNRISDGIYVGGWPFMKADVPPGEPAIIDCTCELPRSVCVKDLPYMCIPTWDSRAPLVHDIEQAVKWASAWRDGRRPVFIHCAFGHGRSVAVTCALLMSLGLVHTWQEAEKKVKDCRPGGRLNSLQIKSLEQWSKQL